MVFLWFCQAVCAAAALVASFFAIRSVLRHHRSVSFYLTLSGAISLVVFLALPGTPSEMILISLLAIATGALLMPAENQRSTRELLDDDIIDIGESTAARRLRK